MKKLALLLLLFPFLLFSDMRSSYVEQFGKHLHAQNTYECKRILHAWEQSYPEDYDVIDAMRGVVFISEGQLEKGCDLLDHKLSLIEGKMISSKNVARIHRCISKAWEFENSGYNSISYEGVFYIQSCENKQPSGVKFRYWFGVAQIVAGFVAAPFSGGTSTALITAGVATLGSAVGDALDNKDKWKDNLNRRQKITPQNTSSYITY